MGHKHNTKGDKMTIQPNNQPPQPQFESSFPEFRAPNLESSADTFLNPAEEKADDLASDILTPSSATQENSEALTFSAKPQTQSPPMASIPSLYYKINGVVMQIMPQCQTPTAIYRPAIEAPNDGVTLKSIGTLLQTLLDRLSFRQEGIASARDLVFAERTQGHTYTVLDALGPLSSNALVYLPTTHNYRLNKYIDGIVELYNEMLKRVKSPQEQHRFIKTYIEPCLATLQENLQNKKIESELTKLEFSHDQLNDTLQKLQSIANQLNNICTEIKEQNVSPGHQEFVSHLQSLSDEQIASLYNLSPDLVRHKINLNQEELKEEISTSLKALNIIIYEIDLPKAFSYFQQTTPENLNSLNEQFNNLLEWKNLLKLNIDLLWSHATEGNLSPFDSDITNMHQKIMGLIESQRNPGVDGSTESDRASRIDILGEIQNALSNIHKVIHGVANPLKRNESILYGHNLQPSTSAPSTSRPLVKITDTSTSNPPPIVNLPPRPQPQPQPIASTSTAPPEPAQRDLRGIPLWIRRHFNPTYVAPTTNVKKLVSDSKVTHGESMLNTYRIDLNNDNEAYRLEQKLQMTQGGLEAQTIDLIRAIGKYVNVLSSNDQHYELFLEKRPSFMGRLKGLIPGSNPTDLPELREHGCTTIRTPAFDTINRNLSRLVGEVYLNMDLLSSHPDNVNSQLRREILTLIQTWKTSSYRMDLSRRLGEERATAFYDIVNGLREHLNAKCRSA